MSVLSACPAGGRARETKVALNGSGLAAARGSGRWPLSRTSKRDRKRVSRKKRPWGDPGTMSPERPEIEKAEPWTSVTAPVACPSDTLSPPKVHGSATAVAPYRFPLKSPRTSPDGGAPPQGTGSFPYPRIGNRLPQVGVPLFQVESLHVAVQGNKIRRGVALGVQ